MECIHFLQWIDREQSNTTCLHQLTVCDYLNGSQNNWMVTQYINISRLGVTELVLNVTFSNVQNCTGNCSEFLEIRTYETYFPDERNRSIPNRYSKNPAVQLRIQPGTNEQFTSLLIPKNGSTPGLYLAVVDPPPGTCVTITRMVLFYYVCPEQELNLVIYPETVAPTSMNANSSSQVSAACLENAVFASQIQPVECNFQGEWDSNNVRCDCRRGYFLETNATASSQGIGMQLVLNYLLFETVCITKYSSNWPQFLEL